MEPSSEYHADNSRSDLSDILEEEEEDLYSDHLGDVQGRGYTVAASRVTEVCDLHQTHPHLHRLCLSCLYRELTSFSLFCMVKISLLFSSVLFFCHA